MGKGRMTKEEMKEYLMSTGLYENTDTDMFYEEGMMSSDEVVSVRDITERFISVDKEFAGKPWNIVQILTNIRMVGTVENKNTERGKLEKLLEWITKEEDQRAEFASKSFEKGSVLGMNIHNAEASECTKIRWIIEDMLNCERNEQMGFNEAYVLMKRGAKIKRLDWTGYWYWSEEYQTIMIHCKDGQELDIRCTENVGFTMDNICQNDWIEVK